MRSAILWAVLALVLVVVNLSILAKERIISDGDTLLLQLRPRDPRSLLQGDYMVLRYSLARQIRQQLNDEDSLDARAVVALDQHGVASFRRLHEDGEPLAQDEHLLAFRARGRHVRLASDAFFFQEGMGEHFARARYGELRVNADGEAVLVGLRNARYERLGELVMDGSEAPRVSDPP